MIGRDDKNGPQGDGVNEEVSFTLNATDRHAVAFAQNSRDEVRFQGDGDMSGAISASPGMKQTTYVCALQSDGGTSQGGHGSGFNDDGSAYTLNGVDRQSASVPVDGKKYVVRRLTPTECERLQGFPDGYTDIPYQGKERTPDTQRYKALGNSFCVPVVRWIGERIQEVEYVSHNH